MFTMENVLSIIRQVLTALGAGLVANGAITGQQLQDGVGAILIFVSVGWSIYKNHQVKQAIQVAAATGTPVKLGIISIPRANK